MTGPSRRRRVAIGAAAFVAASAVSVGAAVAAPQERVDVASAYTPPEHLEQWWYDAMSLDELQRRTDGGKGVTIAVFDGYLDPSVPDLEGADVNVMPGCNDDETPLDMGEEADHGTAMVTALVGQGTGNGPGGRGVLGVVPDATVNFYSMNQVHDDGKPDCSTFFFGEMLLRAAEDGADIVTTQVTGGLVGGVDEQVQELTDQGVLVVSSAGSADSSPGGLIAPPATIAGVVAVSAADNSLRPWVGNPESVAEDVVEYIDIDLGSPGVETPLGGYVDGRWLSGANRTGTSGAAALAAGAFGIVKAAYPEATGNQLIQAAVRSARDGEVSWEPKLGYGPVRAATMMERDPSGWPNENLFAMKPSEVESSLSDADYQDPAAAGSDETEGTTDETPAAQTQAEQEPAAASTDDGGPPVGALAIGGAIGLAVLGGAVLLARRRSAEDT